MKVLSVDPGKGQITISFPRTNEFARPADRFAKAFRQLISSPEAERFGEVSDEFEKLASGLEVLAQNED